MSASRNRNTKVKDNRKQQLQQAFNERNAMIQEQYKAMENEIKSWGDKMIQVIEQHVAEQMNVLKVDCTSRLTLFNQEYTKKLQFISECGDLDKTLFNDVLKEIQALQIEIASLRTRNKKSEWSYVIPSENSSLKTSEAKETPIDQTSPGNQNDSHLINQTTTRTKTTTNADSSEKSSSETSERPKSKSTTTATRQRDDPPEVSVESLDPNCPICYMVFVPTTKLSSRNRHIQGHSMKS